MSVVWKTIAITITSWNMRRRHRMRKVTRRGLKKVKGSGLRKVKWLGLKKVKWSGKRRGKSRQPARWNRWDYPLIWLRMLPALQLRRSPNCSFCFPRQESRHRDTLFATKQTGCPFFIPLVTLVILSSCQSCSRKSGKTLQWSNSWWIFTRNTLHLKEMR